MVWIPWKRNVIASYNNIGGEICPDRNNTILTDYQEANKEGISRIMTVYCKAVCLTDVLLLMLN